MEKLRKFIDLLFNLAYFGLSLTIWIVADQEGFVLVKMSEQKCSHPIVNDALLQMNENLENANFCAYFLFALVLIAFAVDLGHTYTHEWNYCLKNQHGEDQDVLELEDEKDRVIVAINQDYKLIAKELNDKEISMKKDPELKGILRR